MSDLRDVEICRLQEEVRCVRTNYDEVSALNGKLPFLLDEIERLRTALRGLLDEIMCFSIDPPSAAMNHAIEEASRALEPKP